MLKIISTGSAMLIMLTLNSQEKDSALNSFEINTKGFSVTINTVHKELPYALPSDSTISEMNNDVKLYTAETRRGKLNGNWQSWYANGNLCDSGMLINNLPDGEWKYWNENGELIAVRHYSVAKFQRVAEEIKRYHPKRNFYKLSTLYQQNKQAALFHMDAVYSFPQEKNNRPGSLRDLVQYNINNPDFYNPVFEQCLHEGIYINYFPERIIKDSGSYKDGLKQGKWIHRNSADGGRWQGTYQDGIKTKEWKLYDKAGRMNEIIFYNSRGRESWRKKISD
jgi:antitoxin component YwqK of YwqJK toxin-antitoxin module